MAKIGPVFFCEKNFSDKQAVAIRRQAIEIVAGLPDDTAEAVRVLDCAREQVLEWAAGE